MKNFIMLALLTSIFLSCTYYHHQFPYNFEKVSKLIELDEKMNEISGLFYKDENTLYAVKDEEGEIFEVNLKSGEHNKIIDFKDKGDFEGIAKVGNLYYVLKSDGDIYKVEEDGNDEKFTFFDDDDDFEFEGLTYYSEENALLVACKAHGKKDNDDHIYIYSFKLDQEEYAEKAFLKISKESIHKKFKTSAIAIAPNGNLFLVSAISFTLAEITPKGKLINKAQLPYLMYNQVEGICFDAVGNMFLSSEKGDQDHSKIIQLQKNTKRLKH